MGRDQHDIALLVEAHGAGLILPAAAAEVEIAAALGRLGREPQFGISARRLGEAISFTIKSERLVSEMEEIVKV
jgi:hypothetical protein